MQRTRFESLVRQALDVIPGQFRDRLQNVEVVVEDRPSASLLAEMEMAPDDVLFGLYQGTPLTERGWAHGNALPDRIVIYQQPIEEACGEEDEIFDEICLTLIHEAGHYFGLSEEEIEAIEDDFWYGGEAADGKGGDGDDGGARG